MDDFKVSVQDMETIHAYCPKPSALKIKHGLGNISQIPTNIKPVSSTKTLFIEFAYQTSVDNIVKWLKYVRQKYNRVTHLTLSSTYEDHRFEDKGEFSEDGDEETPCALPRHDNRRRNQSPILDWSANGRQELLWIKQAQ